MSSVFWSWEQLVDSAFEVWKLKCVGSAKQATRESLTSLSSRWWPRRSRAFSARVTVQWFPWIYWILWIQKCLNGWRNTRSKCRPNSGTWCWWEGYFWWCLECGYWEGKRTLFLGLTSFSPGVQNYEMPPASCKQMTSVSTRISPCLLGTGEKSPPRRSTRRNAQWRLASTILSAGESDPQISLCGDNLIAIHL